MIVGPPPSSSYHSQPGTAASPGSCVYNDTAGQHSPIYAVMADGIPLYGALGDNGVVPTNLDVCRGHTDTTYTFYHYHITNSMAAPVSTQSTGLFEEVPPCMGLKKCVYKSRRLPGDRASLSPCLPSCFCVRAAHGDPATPCLPHPSPFLPNPLSSCMLKPTSLQDACGTL